MELDLEEEGTWDLVVLAETSYYLGWLYPMFDVGRMAHSLYEATRAGVTSFSPTRFRLRRASCRLG